MIKQLSLGSLPNKISDSFRLFFRKLNKVMHNSFPINIFFKLQNNKEKIFWFQITKLITH